jgi:hypothetical protein
MLNLIIGERVPEYIGPALQALVEKPNRLSAPLAALLTELRESQTSNFVVRVSDSGDGSAGNTAAYISLSGNPASEGILIEEAFLTNPGMIFGQLTWRIETQIGAGPESDPSHASVTLLHEMELHVVPAGLLLQAIVKANLGDGASLPLVLDYLRQEQHLDLDRQLQYVRAAARFRQAVQQDPALNWLGNDLLKGASGDAIEQFALSEKAAPDQGSGARIKWLGTAVAAIKAKGADAAMPPAPPARQARALTKVQTDDALSLMVLRVSERVPMADILDEARTVFRTTVVSTLDQYRKQVVPALLASAPADVTHEGRKVAFLKYHGVPNQLAISAVEAAGTSQPPTLKVTPAWPPTGMQVVWLTPQEHASAWSPFTGLPESVQAIDLANGDLICLDGVTYQVAALDTKPETPRVRASFFRHQRTGKFVALFRLL